MKKMTKYLSLLICSISAFPLHAVSEWNNGLVWEYYDYYESSYVDQAYRKSLLKCTIDSQGKDDTGLFWLPESSRDWVVDPLVGWVYAGETPDPGPGAELREEVGKLSLVITPEYVKTHGWYEFDYEARLFLPIELEDEMTVTLYDFNVKPGDSYRTILFGNYLTTAHVVETSFRDDILDGVRQVKILTDFSIRLFDLDYEPGDELYDFAERCTISYVEKLGNITSGTFTELAPFWYDAADGKRFGTVISNVYDSEGNVVYEGVNFDGFAGISEINSASSDDTPIYDLHGRVVTTTVPGSIYIRDGRKFVAK